MGRLDDKNPRSRWPHPCHERAPSRHEYEVAVADVRRLGHTRDGTGRGSRANRQTPPVPDVARLFLLPLPTAMYPISWPSEGPRPARSLFSARRLARRSRRYRIHSRSRGIDSAVSGEYLPATVGQLHLVGQARSTTRGRSARRPAPPATAALAVPHPVPAAPSRRRRAASARSLMSCSSIRSTWRMIWSQISESVHL
jgi:hypothetical protein